MTSIATPRFAGIGARIRAARHTTGLSQEAFAARIKTSRRHMMRLERGDHRPSAPMVARIVAETGVSETDLLGDDDEESDPVASITDALNLMVTLAVAKALGRVPA